VDGLSSEQIIDGERADLVRSRALVGKRDPDNDWQVAVDKGGVRDGPVREFDLDAGRWRDGLADIAKRPFRAIAADRHHDRATVVGQPDAAAAKAADGLAVVLVEIDEQPQLLTESIVFLMLHSEFPTAGRGITPGDRGTFAQSAVLRHEPNYRDLDARRSGFTAAQLFGGCWLPCPAMA
jgi:hypothetical protein